MRDTPFQSFSFFIMVFIILGGFVFAIYDCRERERERSSAPAQEESFLASVPDKEPENWDWVEVVEPTENGNIEFKIGDSCGIQSGGMVAMIHKTEEVVTARYFFPREAYGTECPDCTLFEVTPEEWERLYQIYK